MRRMVNRYKKDLLVDMHKVKTLTQTSVGVGLEGDWGPD